MANASFNALVNITANVSGQSAIGQIKGEIKGLGDTVQQVSGTLKGLAGAFAIKETVSYIKSIIDLGDHLNDLSHSTGLQIQTLSDLKAAAEDGGVGFDQLEGSLKKFTLNIGQAVAGSQEQERAFNKLGISVNDLKTKDPSELIYKSADGFSKLTSATDKATIARAIFGKSGVDLARILDDGSASIRGLGVEIGTEFAQRADQFNDSINKIKRIFQSTTVVAATEMLPALQDITGALIQYLNSSKGADSFFKGFGDGLKKFSSIALGFTTYFSEGIDTAYSTLNQFGNYLGYVASKFQSWLSSATEDQYQQKQLEIDKSYYSDKGKLLEDYVKRSEDRFKRLDDFNKALDQGTTFTPTKRKASIGADEDLGKKKESERDAIEKWRITQMAAIEARYLELDAVKMTKEEYEKLSAQRKIEAEAAEKSVGKTARAKKGYQDAAEAIIAAKNALADFEEQQRESFGQGILQGMNEYKEKARDVATQSKQLFTDAFSGMEDALVEFVKTGTLSFAKLADAIESDLIRIAIRKALVFGLETVASAFAGGASSGSAAGGTIRSGGTMVQGFANGGIMTAQGSVPLRKYATGGIANSPQMALFGEGSRPEAYVPLPDGRNIPVKMDGASGGTNVVVNVNVASNGATTDDAQSSVSSGKVLGQMISNAVKSILITEKRPGGLLA